MNRIKRFEADANVKIDVEFIDIRDRQIHITYQQPGQFNIKSDGLALLPKKGMNMAYLSLLHANHTALSTGEESIRGIPARIIKIIPESDTSDIVLAQLWLDPVTVRLMRMKTFTRTSGSYMVDFEYHHKDALLPDRVTVSFKINDLMFPTKAMNELMTKGLQKPDSIPKTARVIVDYSNYFINGDQGNHASKTTAWHP
ncbi:MAG: hypothetical protein J7L89_04590 [Bacteroidales bacterium]|nr:hypothetical protein [Bacteroidales bacterium]